VLLISIDTLRADHLGVYGYERDTSPSLDAFAATAAVYEEAAAPTPWTLPSHAALLTGTHPHRLGLLARDAALPEHARSVAEDLWAHGYDTAAFVDSTPRGYLGGERGFARGFEVYRHAPFPEVRGEAGAFPYDARRTVAAVEAWLAERASRRPFFLFVHTKTVHTRSAGTRSADGRHLPYQVPDAADTLRFVAPERRGDAYPWREADGTKGVELLRVWNERDPPARREDFPDERLALLRDLYDGGIRYTDGALGRLLARFDAPGARERTVVVVTADHGEEFLEHGRFLHTQVYREALRVPLLVRVPGAPPRRVEAPVTLMDVAHSLRAWAGLPPGGRTLAEAEGAVAPAPRVAYRDVTGGAPGERSYRYEAEPWRLVVREGPDGATSRLFHRDDPAEQRPRREPGVEARLQVGLARWLAGVEPATGARIEVDAETREHLRALGYAEE